MTWLMGVSLAISGSIQNIKMVRVEVFVQFFSTVLYLRQKSAGVAEILAVDWFHVMSIIRLVPRNVYLYSPI